MAIVNKKNTQLGGTPAVCGLLVFLRLRLLSSTDFHRSHIYHLLIIFSHTGSNTTTTITTVMSPTSLRECVGKGTAVCVHACVYVPFFTLLLTYIFRLLAGA